MIRVLVCTVALCPLLLHGETLGPYDLQCRVLERTAWIVRADPSTAVSRLNLLRSIALGTVPDLSPAVEERLALAKGAIRQKEFSSREVRQCALKAIGDMNIPEALEFLESIQRADLGADASQYLWDATLRAAKTARLRTILSHEERTIYLERIIRERPRGGAIAWWAVNTLCDTGASRAFPTVRTAIETIWRTMGLVDQEIRFCEVRMQAINQDVDRVKALGMTIRSNESSVANDSNSAEARLVRWAVQQLHDMHDPAADAELQQATARIRLSANVRLAREINELLRDRTEEQAAIAKYKADAVNRSRQ